MARRKTHVPLNVYLNNRFVGRLTKETSGAIEFAYDPAWLGWEHALPVSMSLPLRETRYTGAPVAAFFENLLPDSPPIRSRVAERVGAAGSDAYSLLSKIGRDCVGALQFVPDGEEAPAHEKMQGIALSDAEIEGLLSNLARAPLGLNEEDEFRISVAGAQEKTALLWHEGRWKKPIGTTPTTHIFKPQIGQIQTSSGLIDLSNSVENEYYCLKLVEALGLPANQASIATFGKKKVLIVERFDRRHARDGRLLRLPQEDCCQALSVPPGRKYQNHGGPGIVAIMKLLRASDTPMEDQLAFFKSQLIFWLIGATDGHAKNFSLFLNPGGRFNLTPFYDVLTAQPSFDRNQIPHRAFRLAMSVGSSRKYKILDIHGRHFVETAKEAGLGPAPIATVIGELREAVEPALERLPDTLPKGFPPGIHRSVAEAARARLKQLETAKV
jgi:serine/threonine-protein kinase HipA